MGVVYLRRTEWVCCDHLIEIVDYYCKYSVFLAAGLQVRLIPIFLEFQVQEGLINSAVYDLLFQTNANQCSVWIH